MRPKAVLRWWLAVGILTLLLRFCPAPRAQKPPEPNARKPMYPRRAPRVRKPQGAKVLHTNRAYLPARIFHFRVLRAVGLKSQFWKEGSLTESSLHELPKNLQNIAIAHRIQEILTADLEDGEVDNPFKRFDLRFAIVVADARLPLGILMRGKVSYEDPALNDWIEPARVGSGFSGGMADYPAWTRRPVMCDVAQQRILYSGSDIEFGQPCPEGGSATLKEETWSVEGNKVGTAPRNIMIFWDHRSISPKFKRTDAQSSEKFYSALDGSLSASMDRCIKQDGFYTPPVNLTEFANCFWEVHASEAVEPYRGMGIRLVRRSVAVMPAAFTHAIAESGEPEQPQDPGLCNSLIEEGHLYLQSAHIPVRKNMAPYKILGTLTLRIFILPHVVMW